MNRIKELRNKKGLTVAELANIINVSPSMLSNYENSKSEPRNKEIWTRLASFFDVSVPYIRGFNADKININNVEKDYFIEKMLSVLAYEEAQFNEIKFDKKDRIHVISTIFNELLSMLNRDEVDLSKIKDDIGRLRHTIIELETVFDSCLELYKEHSKTYDVLLDLLKEWWAYNLSQCFA